MARPVKLLQAAVIMRMEPQAILVVVLVGFVLGFGETHTNEETIVPMGRRCAM